MAGNVQNKYLKKYFLGHAACEVAFWAMTKNFPKKFFSLFLSPPCRETPENAIKTFLEKKTKKKKKAGRYFFESLSGKCAWVFGLFFFARPSGGVDSR